MANISDVAELAGLSVSTVSRVINNHKYVTEDKRQKVLEAMDSLNYQPSTAARQLRGQQAKILGIIVPRITNPFFSYLVDEIQKRSLAKGFQLMIFQSDEDKEKELSFLQLLSQKQIDGVIMCAVENSEEVISSYLKYGPIILCNEKFANSDLPTVSLDQEKGAYMGVNYLLNSGCTKIAYCTGGLFAENGKDKERNDGYSKALKSHGLKANPDWIFVDQHTIEDGKQIANKINEMPDKPDGLFTGSDEVAVGFIVEAAKLGIDVPNEIAVIGFDDQPIAELTSPSLTTIRQPINELGKQTIDLMFSILEKKPYNIEKEKLVMNLVIRESA